MKNILIYKILSILSIVIITIFSMAGYFFNKSDNSLIDEIRSYNLNTAMNSLDQRLEERLSLNENQMKETLQMITKNSTNYLLDFDKDGLKKSLEFDMKKEGLVAVSIWDNSLNESFLSALKKDNKIIFINDIPKSFEKYVKLSDKIKILNNGEYQEIGSTTLFYDESIIRKQIEELKQKTKKSIENFNKTIDSQKTKSNYMKLIVILIAMIAILILLSLLFINFVNKPLKILQNGLDEFFLFLQNKKDHINQISINTNDEFGQMFKNLNENISVSAKLHEEIHELNTNLEERIAEKTSKVITLLDNAGQGFLTFNTDFIVDEEYSKECEKLLGENIAYCDISELLFKTKKDKQELFKTSLTNAINETQKIKRSAYISLLPSVVLLNKKAVKLEYKILNSKQFMLILTNITSQKKLENKIKKEQQTLKMIVAIVSESEVFYELKKEYESFIKNYETHIDKTKTPLNNISTLYRLIHTFKGTFSQLFMQEVVDFLHQIESNISALQKNPNSTNKNLLETLESYDFMENFDKSLEVIKDILGTEFLESDNYLKVDIQDISILQEKIQNVLSNHDNTSDECKDILCQVQNLSNHKLLYLLQPYISTTLQLAQRLDKELYEFDIVGDKYIVVPENFKPFIKSLVHVFRNSIDHGIESAEERLSKDKDECGTIACSFELDEDKNLHIIISDDGQGLDVELLKDKLSKLGVDTSLMDEKEILNAIFEDSFSTKQTVTDISGRGVGLSAVKYEISKLNGKIDISSQKNVGTTFEFIIPVE